MDSGPTVFFGLQFLWSIFERFCFVSGQLITCMASHITTVWERKHAAIFSFKCYFSYLIVDIDNIVDLSTCAIPNLSTYLDTRLVFGGTRFAGVVQVLVAGVWMDVCRDEWRQEDANVACRQLGYVELPVNPVECWLFRKEWILDQKLSLSNGEIYGRQCTCSKLTKISNLTDQVQACVHGSQEYGKSHGACVQCAGAHVCFSCSSNQLPVVACEGEVRNRWLTIHRNACTDNCFAKEVVYAMPSPSPIYYLFGVVLACNHIVPPY